MINQLTDAETGDSDWNWLYKIAGAVAVLSAVFLPLQIIVFFISPPPSTVLGWFTLFQNNRLFGLLDMDLLMIVDNALLIPIVLALQVALRRESESVMAIATTIWLVAIATYFASNPAINLLSLSDQYATAATEAQRAMFLAAGQAMLTMWTGTAFQIFYILGSLAPILVSVVMLRSNLFGKVIAYMGILANVIALGIYVPTIGVYIAIFSVLFLEVWYILIGRRLLQLGQGSQRTRQIGNICV